MVVLVVLAAERPVMQNLVADFRWAVAAAGVLVGAELAAVTADQRCHVTVDRPVVADLVSAALENYLALPATAAPAGVVVAVAETTITIGSATHHVLIPATDVGTTRASLAADHAAATPVGVAEADVLAVQLVALLGTSNPDVVSPVQVAVCLDQLVERPTMRNQDAVCQAAVVTEAVAVDADAVVPRSRGLAFSFQVA